MAGEDVTFCQYKLNVMQNAVVQCQIISSGIIHLQTLNWICFATMYIWCEDFNTNIDDMYVVCRNMKCQHNLLGCLSNPPFFGSKHSNVNKVIFVFMMDKSRCLLPVSVFSVSSQWVIQGRGSQFKKSWSPPEPPCERHRLTGVPCPRRVGCQLPSPSGQSGMRMTPPLLLGAHHKSHSRARGRDPGVTTRTDPVRQN